MQHVQEPAQLKEAVKALYRKHASGAPQDADPGGDLQREYKRRAPVRGLANVLSHVTHCAVPSSIVPESYPWENTSRAANLAKRLGVKALHVTLRACSLECMLDDVSMQINLCIATLRSYRAPPQGLPTPPSPLVEAQGRRRRAALGRAAQAAGVPGEERGGPEAQAADHHGRAPRGHRALPAGARAAALLPLPQLCQCRAYLHPGTLVHSSSPRPWTEIHAASLSSAPAAAGLCQHRPQTEQPNRATGPRPPLAHGQRSLQQSALRQDLGG